MFKKTQLYFLAAFAFIIIVLVFVVMFSGSNNPSQQPPTTLPVISPRPSTNFQPLEIKPILTDEVPLKPANQGGGVKLDSPVVIQSQEEIKKLTPLLPYQDSFANSSGETISVLIPDAKYQETPWLLDAQVYGIDYQINEGEKDYDLQKESFLGAAANIFDWMKANNINPEKIIINWGDRSYIRKRAEGWLNQ